MADRKNSGLLKNSGNSKKNKGARKTGADPLDALGVIRRLEVGPVRLERNRVTASYTVHAVGGAHATELIYRYEEDVFDPHDPASRNLADMIAAQLALNYGLFCNEIVFHGLYDDHDRRFLIEMAENTAREIFVKKFLEPNIFLQGAAANLQPVKKKSYLRARMLFADGPKVESDGIDGYAPRPWAVDRNRICVLSSGGKDSLLSHGLLDEIGYESHPVFINESGRHWFTALNAYRHFAENVPHTARVWTNSDRLFAWMLRHLPFIRKDFADIRSDEYPVRLWTVAVFLFGALPLLRKRGIGRLVIGDEFDTTHRTSHKGITHYDGLYDQSRYFDNALTRYYQRKGWYVSQFSILRPLSELFIEKILVNRYPELQALQMSCHATHKDADRVLPCGRCEKCRRIVGMLLALGANPERCGYTREQIDHCLKSLAEKGVHQEAEGARHMAYLLRERGLVDKHGADFKKAGPRKEVLKLRFDRERSPVEGIPHDLREPLYRIYLEYAEGAVRRRGRTWIAMDPLKDAALDRPYPFETAKRSNRKNTGRERISSTNGPSHNLGTFTWPEAEKRFKEIDVALLPVGAIEQHGPHLPLDTDAFDANHLASEVAKACSHPKPIVFPLISYGVSYHHKDFSSPSWSSSTGMAGTARPSTSPLR
jgi:hypothetical protein